MSKPRSTPASGAPCLKCGTNNPPLNQFCLGCGEPIHSAGYVTCPGCGRENPWAASFCGGCGGELPATLAALG